MVGSNATNPRDGPGRAVMSGRGIAVPTRVIGLSGNLAFGDVAVGTSATTPLTISNSGNSLLTWSGLSTGNGVFTASPTSGTVAAGGSANVTLTFTPAARTSYSSTLTVTSDATSGTNTATVSGTTATRILRAALTTPIPSTAVGARGYGSVTFWNDGDSVMTCHDFSTSASPIVTVEAWNFPDPGTRSLEPGQSATLTILFMPTGTETITGTITVGCADATSGSPSVVSFTATGGSGATTRVLGLSGSLAFGAVQVGTSATRTLTLSNTGNSLLTWSELSTGNGVFTASPTSGAVQPEGLNPGDAPGTVTVTFTPAAATSYSDTLTVTSDATVGPTPPRCRGRALPPQSRRRASSGCRARWRLGTWRRTRVQPRRSPSATAGIAS